MVTNKAPYSSLWPNSSITTEAEMIFNMFQKKQQWGKISNPSSSHLYNHESNKDNQILTFTFKMQGTLAVEALDIMRLLGRDYESSIFWEPIDIDWSWGLLLEGRRQKYFR